MQIGRTINSVFDDVELHQKLIAEECDAVKELLLKKNRDYGSSFAKSGGIFTRELDAEAKLLVRMEDKLERIRNGNAPGEDTFQDLNGYLILHRVLLRLKALALEEAGSRGFVLNVPE